MSRPTMTAAQLVAALYEDPAQCARVAKLRYVSPDEPGLTRLRRGRGFTYRDDQGVTVVDVALRDRIAKIAIPPAWRKVWIATWPDAHLLAVGEDERGRRQYVHHERWRSIRDQLNFYRLLGFGAAMPAIRADVDRQLRRRTLDADRVLAAMLRIMDLASLRVGNEVYAEENESYGLSTLTRKHVHVQGARIDFRFPAKSGEQADVSITDAGVARVVTKLAAQRSRRLFTIGGVVVGSEEINARLAQLSGAHFTAKDFRTWKGSAPPRNWATRAPSAGRTTSPRRRRRVHLRRADAFHGGTAGAPIDLAVRTRHPRSMTCWTPERGGNRWTRSSTG